MNGYFSIMGGLQWCSAAIMRNVPEHHSRVELTCGRGEVIWMLRPPAGREILNDKDDLIIRMHSIVKGYNPKLRSLLESKEWKVNASQFYRFREAGPLGDDADFLHAMIMLFAGGKRGDEVFKDVFWIDREGRDLRPVLDRIRYAAHRMRRVELTCEDALSALNRHVKDPDTFVFIDPPYPSRERYYRVHDFPWAAICTALATACCKWMLVSDINLSTRVGEGKRLGKASVLSYIRGAHSSLVNLSESFPSIRIKEPYRLCQQFKNRLQFNGKQKEYVIVANYPLQPVPKQATLSFEREVTTSLIIGG